MNDKFIRTEMLLGSENMKVLSNSKVAVFGVGGVGSYAVESLVRSGIGSIVLIDYDTIAESNINRQIHSNMDTLGILKVEAMKERILRINPEIEVRAINMLVNYENIEDVLSNDIDYVVDAIDMVSSKLTLIEKCKEKNLRIISAMGAGNKVNPTLLEVADLYETSVCPLAKVMRRELKKRNIKTLKVVYSKEKPLEIQIKVDNANERKKTPGSTSFVPPVSGLIIASEVVKDLIEWK